MDAQLNYSYFYSAGTTGLKAHRLFNQSSPSTAIHVDRSFRPNPLGRCRLISSWACFAVNTFYQLLLNVPIFRRQCHESWALKALKSSFSTWAPIKIPRGKNCMKRIVLLDKPSVIPFESSENFQPYSSL